MRSAIVVAVMAIVGFLLILATPSPGNPGFPAQATHQGDIACPTDPPPTTDGIIQPGEYVENYFDARTKIEVFFTCPETEEGIIHVGLVSPWSDWTEFRLQSTEFFNGDYNVLRTRVSGSSAEVLDGFSAGASPGFVEDLSLGGTFDVLEAVGTQQPNYNVYEYAFSMSSADSYDSQLPSSGSFNFQVAGTEASLLVESDTKAVEVGEHILDGIWTEVGLSLPEGNEALAPTEILVSLRDDSFAPMAFRSVTVFVQTTYGFLDLGREVTNQEGLATVEYTPRGEGEYLIGAAFAGEGGYLASVKWSLLTVIDLTPGPTSVFAGLHVADSLIFLIVAGVWLTYGYAVFTVSRVMRRKRSGPRRSLRERLRAR